MMEFTVSMESAEMVACDAVAVGVFQQERELDGAAARVDRALGGLLGSVIAEEHFEAKPAKTLVLHTHGKIPARRIIVVGLGPRDRATPEVFRRGAAGVIRQAMALHVGHVAFPPAALPPHAVDAVTQARVEGIMLGAYRFTRYKKADDGEVQQVTLLTGGADQRRGVEDGLRRGQIFAEATIFARDLVNEPPNQLAPSRLAEIAADAARRAGLRCSVLDVDAMEALGMGALLSIGAGSDHPPRLIVMEYAPPRAQRTVGLVGKGVCFDSGGINLKRESLEWMKSDMAGGAAVIATMQTLPVLRVPCRVLGVVAAVENMLSGTSVKPGDIVRAMNGKTIEINNTDAEGRVILADALAYTVRQRPDEVIDLATLTGSAMVALGFQAAALLGNDQDLANRLLAAAERASERLWQLPLYEEYLEDMRSAIADLRNSGSRYGGSQKGAAFLREFVNGTPWAHLDIAPTAYLEQNEGTGPYLPKGATGYGVRTLLTYLLGVS